jgi:hypothetical protein
VTSEPGKAQNVNHQPDYGVVAYLKERDRPKQSMASITKGTWILMPVRGCAGQSRPYCKFVEAGLGTDARRIPSGSSPIRTEPHFWDYFRIGGHPPRMIDARSTDTRSRLYAH